MKNFFESFKKAIGEKTDQKKESASYERQPPVPFAEFIVQLKQLPLNSIRTDLPELFVCVVEKDQLSSFTKKLDEYFGQPIKPAGDFPSRDARHVSAPFGGILKNQTMYYLENEGCFQCAMLWPWDDGVHITAKVINESLEKLKSATGGKEA